MYVKYLILLTTIILASCSPQEVIVPMDIKNLENSTKAETSESPLINDSSTAKVDEEAKTSSQEVSDSTSTSTLASVDSRKPKTESSNETRELFKVDGNYYFEDMDVDKPVDSQVNFVDSILNNILSIIVKIGGNFEVVSDPIPLDLSDLDKDVVKELYIYEVNLEIIKPEETNATLKFMKELQIKMVDKDNPEKQLVALSFKLSDEENKKYAEQCKYKCLRIPVSDDNLLKFLGGSKNVLLKPIIKLGEAPKDNFAVKGSIRFRVKLDIDI